MTTKVVESSVRASAACLGVLSRQRGDVVHQNPFSQEFEHCLKYNETPDERPPQRETDPSLKATVLGQTLLFIFSCK